MTQSQRQAETQSQRQTETQSQRRTETERDRTDEDRDRDRKYNDYLVNPFYFKYIHLRIGI